MTKLCQRPDPNPRRPRLQAPPGATDTHFHTFGPVERYPFLEDRRFTPPDASVSSYLHLHRTLGLSRAVLVQASMYGTDNRRQLDAAKEMDIPTRVIVVVPATANDRELTDLHKQGARGVRFISTQPRGLRSTSSSASPTGCASTGGISSSCWRRSISSTWNRASPSCAARSWWTTWPTSGRPLASNSRPCRLSCGY